MEAVAFVDVLPERARGFAPPPERGDAFCRLRDLRGRTRVLVLVAFALALVPFVAALVRAYSVGWLPSGDEANIATRSLDVFSRHPPLTGLSTTTAFYGKHILSHHPGPIEFYLLAVPVRVLGATAGSLLTAAAINASFVLIALWAVLRRAGPTVMLWAAVLMQLVMWSGGTSVLTDTLSSNMTMYSLLCTAVLAWAIADGDYRLLPLGAFAASYAAQQHLAAGVMVVAVGGVAILALAVAVAGRARRGDRDVVRSALRWSAAALAVVTVCWLPPIIDQATGHPGNFTAIIRYARDNTRPKLGPRSGVIQVIRTIVPPSVIGRSDTIPELIIGHANALQQLAAVLVVAALILVLVWKRRRPLSRLAGITLVVLAAGAVNGSNVPFSEEQWRISLYRWTWTAAFLTWLTLGWAAALVVQHWLDQHWHDAHRSSARRVRTTTPVVLVSVAALLAALTASVNTAGDRFRQRPAFALEKRTAAAVLHRLDRRRPILVVYSGDATIHEVGPYLTLRLVQAGYTVQLPPLYAEPFLGENREYRRDGGAAAIVVVSGLDRPPKRPWTRLTTQWFDPVRAKLLDELAASARGQPVELAADGKAIIRRAYGPQGHVLIDPLVRELARDPRVALAQPALLDLIERGAFRSPRLDPVTVRRARARVAKRLGAGPLAHDKRVDVFLLSPQQLRDASVTRLQ